MNYPLPFDTVFITSTLLKPEYLIGLEEQARYVLHAFSETGAGLNELTALLPEDILLDAEIPGVCAPAWLLGSTAGR